MEESLREVENRRLGLSLGRWLWMWEGVDESRSSAGKCLGKMDDWKSAILK